MLNSTTGIGGAPTWLQCAAAQFPLLFFAVNLFQVLTFVTLVSLFVVALRCRFRLRS